MHYVHEQACVLLFTQGPEPMMSDFPCEQYEEIPVFQEPAQMELPEWRAPVQRLPQWVPPCEPGPIGFMRGTCPVLIVDVSGTMNPKQRGRFKDMKACSVRLLHAEGECFTRCKP